MWDSHAADPPPLSNAGGGPGGVAQRPRCPRLRSDRCAGALELATRFFGNRGEGEGRGEGSTPSPPS